MPSANLNELLLTGDSSHTLLSKRFGVTYHSRHGAVEESRHVFIEAGVRPFLDDGAPAPATAPKNLNILEMGMGTALNALLVRLLARENPGTRFTYHTFEKYPLAASEVERLNYDDLLDIPPGTLAELHREPWGEPTRLEPNFFLQKIRRDFLETNTGDYFPDFSIDVIFYDAFAPNSQPELWSPDALGVCYKALRTGGVLTTYCAKGQFKRDLRALGFAVEALPGPPGKREMTRASKSH